MLKTRFIIYHNPFKTLIRINLKYLILLKLIDFFLLQFINIFLKTNLIT